MVWYEGGRLHIGYLDQKDLQKLLFQKTTVPLPACWLLQQFVTPTLCCSTLVCEVIACLNLLCSVYNPGKNDIV